LSHPKTTQLSRSDYLSKINPSGWDLSPMFLASINMFIFIGSYSVVRILASYFLSFEDKVIPFNWFIIAKRITSNEGFWSTLFSAWLGSLKFQRLSNINGLYFNIWFIKELRVVEPFKSKYWHYHKAGLSNKCIRNRAGMIYPFKESLLKATIHSFRILFSFFSLITLCSGIASK